MEKAETKAKKKARPARTRPGFRMPKAAEVLADHFRRRIIRGELKEGDRLRIDFNGRRMDILVDKAELDERRKTWKPVEHQLSGWLARYRKLVANASKGAVLTA